MSPTYSFKCSVCSQSKEAFASFDEELQAPKCDYCGMIMARDWTAPAIILKGTGWGKDK